MKNMNRAQIQAIDFERVELKEIRQGLKKEFNHKFKVTRGTGCLVVNSLKKICFEIEFFVNNGRKAIWKFQKKIC